MSAADWWASKVPAQPRQSPLYVPGTALQPPPAPQYPQQAQQPYGAPQQQPQLQGNQKLNNVPFSQVLALANAGQIPTYGAEAARTQNQFCPSCGGNEYFSVQSAAPRCFTCGYTGSSRFPQQDPDAPQQRQ